VSKFSHVIWSFLVLSCYRYSCLVHQASHNVKEPWNTQCLQHVATENIKCLFYHLPQSQQIYSTETLYLPGYIVRGAVLTIMKERHLLCTNISSKMGCLKGVLIVTFNHPNTKHILGLKIKTVYYNKPNYLGHPTICLYSHLKQLYSTSYSWRR
jgi:hypothetical protein